MTPAAQPKSSTFSIKEVNTDKLSQVLRKIALHEESFLLGCDPEIFLQKDGEIVSAHDIVPGTKEEPFQIDDVGTKVLSDGIALEFNIAPATDQAEFNFKIETALKNIEACLPKGVTFLKGVTGAHLSPAFMNLLPPEVAELGCNPDFNAYTSRSMPEKNVPNENFFDNPFRCVAGHLHIGFNHDPKPFEYWNQEVQARVKIITNAETTFNNTRVANTQRLCSFVEFLDAFVGIPLWMEDETKGKDLRMKLYGNLGAFRYKPYGVEYRTPSNAWLWDAKLRNSLFARVQQAVEGSHLWDKLATNHSYGISCIHNLYTIQKSFRMLKTERTITELNHKHIAQHYKDFLEAFEKDKYNCEYLDKQKAIRDTRKKEEKKTKKAAKATDTTPATSGTQSSMYTLASLNSKNAF